MDQYKKEFIELCLKYHAIRFGEFTLKSGRKSPYFYNSGLLNTGAALAVLGKTYANAIVSAGLEFDMLFGPAYKGIPLVSATSVALSEHFQLDVPYAFNRKEAKDHGEGGTIVGAPLQGKVLVIDDVITAGTAIKESIDIIQAKEAQLAGVVISLDRQEKGQGDLSAIQEIEKSQGITVANVINLNDLMAYLDTEPSFQALLPSIEKYRKEYGVALV